MFTIEFLQQYWWVIIALLGGLLVFLLFVQGANAMIFVAGKNETERQMMVNSTGRKWELTFTTLVTFGGAFFASFPLFYSTSFGGAFWLWVAILITFVFQAVSYEFQNKAGNVIGRNAFRAFLTVNGLLGPFLLGVAVCTFFTGSEFTVDKSALFDVAAPTISTWSNEWHGLEALGNLTNVTFGLAVMFLAICLGLLYLLSNIRSETLERRFRKYLMSTALVFALLFVTATAFILISDGYAVENGRVSLEPYKYWHNLLAMPGTAALFVLGVVLVLTGLFGTAFCKGFRHGIWYAGTGTVTTVMALFFLAGFNGTAYYPSTTDLQSSLTLSNSSSSAFTLTVMTWVSFLIPAVLAYIVYAWRQMDRKPITKNEIENTDLKY